MATQQEYTAVANALVTFFLQEVHKLPPMYQGFIPIGRIPEAAGATAKIAVDALDAFRTQEKP